MFFMQPQIQQEVITELICFISGHQKPEHNIGDERVPTENAGEEDREKGRELHVVTIVSRDSMKTRRTRRCGAASQTLPLSILLTGQFHP